MGMLWSTAHALFCFVFSFVRHSSFTVIGHLNGQFAFSITQANLLGWWRHSGSPCAGMLPFSGHHHGLLLLLCMLRVQVQFPNSVWHSRPSGRTVFTCFVGVCSALRDRYDLNA